MGDPVRVVVDSSTCLAPEDAARAGITVVPMRVEIDGREYRDGRDLNAGDFYRSLRANGHATHSTSAPTPGDYADAFRDAAADVLCLTVASSLSAMHQAASLAAGMVDGGRRVRVVDSGTAAPGLQLLARAAATVAAGGAALDEVEHRVTRLAARVHMFGTLATIEYLARGGRVPQVASWGATVLNVRPVVRFEHGGAHLLQLARGQAGARRALLRHTVRAAEADGAAPSGANVHLVVFHGDAIDEARAIEAELRARFADVDIAVSEFTPAMGVHTGPGVTGTALYVDPA